MASPMKNFSCLRAFVAILFIFAIPTTETRVINRTDAAEHSKADEFAIAKCRQRCFLQTLPNFMFHSDINSPESLQQCRSNPNCYMCHDYCRVLTVAASDLSTSMCTDKLFCTTGCRIACQYHKIKIIDHLINELVNKS